MENMQIFTKRLNEIMKQFEVNQKQLAVAINASTALTCIWCNGKSYPSIYYLKKIADYFNVCADYLLGRQDWY